MTSLHSRLPSTVLAAVATAAFGLSACTRAAEPPTPTEASADTATVVSELPLERGFYVRTDDTCATASSASAAVLGRGGLFWSTSTCTFGKIEQTGATTFRVEQACGDPGGQGAPGAVAEWVVTDRNAFRFVDDAGWEHEARLCAQQDMPADFRDMDISALTR